MSQNVQAPSFIAMQQEVASMQQQIASLEKDMEMSRQRNLQQVQLIHQQQNRSLLLVNQTARMEGEKKKGEVGLCEEMFSTMSSVIQLPVVKNIRKIPKRIVAGATIGIGVATICQQTFPLTMIITALGAFGGGISSMIAGRGSDQQLWVNKSP